MECGVDYYNLWVHLFPTTFVFVKLCSTKKNFRRVKAYPVGDFACAAGSHVRLYQFMCSHKNFKIKYISSTHYIITVQAQGGDKTKFHIFLLLTLCVRYKTKKKIKNKKLSFKKKCQNYVLKTRRVRQGSPSFYFIHVKYVTFFQEAVLFI